MLSDVVFSSSVSSPVTHSPCFIIKSESGSAIHFPILSGINNDGTTQPANVLKNVAVKCSIIKLHVSTIAI